MIEDVFWLGLIGAYAALIIYLLFGGQPFG